MSPYLGLRDHFRPPLSTRRHWHAFHNGWATFLAEDLNDDEVLLDSTLTAELAPDATVDYDEEGGIVGAEILLQGGVIPYFEPSELKNDIAGTNVDDARLYLEDSFPSLTEPTVDRGPGWLPGGLPRFDWRIQLIVEPGP